MLHVDSRFHVTFCAGHQGGVRGGGGGAGGGPGAGRVEGVGSSL